MIETIRTAMKTDDDLEKLFDDSREYAQVYLLAKQRHKGCSGTGELMTLKEEFKDTIDKMIRQCRKKAYLSGPCEYDPDAIAEALMKVGRK